MIANSGWQTEPGYVPPQDVAVDRGAGGVRQGGRAFSLPYFGVKEERSGAKMKMSDD